MASDARVMLEDLLDIFQSKFHDQYQAWDRFIEFLAGDNSVRHFLHVAQDFDWFLKDREFANSIVKRYDSNVLRADYYDHIGELYLDKIVSRTYAKQKGQFLTPPEVAELTATMTIPKTQDQIMILDPCVGSGRLLMAAHKQAPNAELYGIDVDIRMARLTMTNFAIHKINGHILNANTLVHETDPATPEGKHNWNYTNSWHSQIDKLKYIKRSDPSKNYNLPL